MYVVSSMFTVPTTHRFRGIGKQLGRAGSLAPGPSAVVHLDGEVGQNWLSRFGC